jgi:methyltransferase (TIGR00027 family)
MEPVIRNISDTSLWVAIYRADETERSDAVFRDPFARKLAGKRGEQIVAAMESGRKNSWSFVARTWLIDDFVRQYTQAGFEQVVNLASGLDTRPYRLDLPASLTWIDADLPEISAYMNEMMKGEKTCCIHERVAIDLADREKRLEFFHQISSRGKKTLVITEGLLVYLTEVEAGAFAFDLSHTPGFDRWVIDLVSPPILPLIAQEMGTILTDAKSPLQFAPTEGEDFFRLFGWKPIESVSRLKTAAKLNRLSEQMMVFAAMTEPPGTTRNYPWAGICVFDSTGK